MVHTRKLCPHCGRIVSRDGGYSLGSPVRICFRCGKKHIDKYVREPAFFDRPEPIKFYQVLLARFWPFGFATILMLIIALAAVDHISGLLLPLFPFIPYVLLVWSGWRKRNELLALQLAEYEASKERVKDKNYVMLLLDHKCYVPFYFLKFHHKDLVDYRPKGPSLPSYKDSSYIT